MRKHKKKKTCPEGKIYLPMLSMLSIPRVELAVCKLNSDFAGGGKKMLQNQKISCLSKCMLSTQHVLIGVHKKNNSQDSVRTINISRGKLSTELPLIFPKTRIKAPTN